MVNVSPEDDELFGLLTVTVAVPVVVRSDAGTATRNVDAST